jgi:hypothetical protein
MDPTRNGDSCAPKRLSLAQKCDLAGQAIAAIVTSGLIAAPFITGVVRETPRIESVMVTSAPEVALVETPQLPPPNVAAPRRSRTAPVKSTFAARAVPAVFVDSSRADAMRKDGARKPLGRKLASIFIGDGAHTVRPFPTIPQ